MNHATCHVISKRLNLTYSGVKCDGIPTSNRPREETSEAPCHRGVIFKKEKYKDKETNKNKMCVKSMMSYHIKNVCFLKTVIVGKQIMFIY